MCDGTTTKSALTVQQAVQQELFAASAIEEARTTGSRPEEDEGGMSGAGQFFLTVFILGLVGSAGYFGYKRYGAPSAGGRQAGPPALPPKPSSMSKLPTSEESQVGLPAGWRKFPDPEGTGDFYYLRPDGTTTWDAPPAAGINQA